MVLPRKQERRANRREWLLNLQCLLKDKKVPIEKVYDWVNGAGKEWLSMKTLQRHRKRLLQKLEIDKIEWDCLDPIIDPTELEKWEIQRQRDKKISKIYREIWETKHQLEQPNLTEKQKTSLLERLTILKWRLEQSEESL